MRFIVIAFAVIMLSGCMMADMTREAFSGTKEMKTVRAVKVNESEPVDAKQKPYQQKIQAFLRTVRGERIGQMNKEATAFFASAAKRNGHALVTSAGSILLSEAHVGGSYIQVNVYREDQLEKALTYYKNYTSNKGGRYAANGLYVLYTDKDYANVGAIFNAFAAFKF